MLTCVGDLVEDVVVHLGGPVNLASDTEAAISRRRGGSAANVVAVAAAAGHAARFVGQVGDDAVGAVLEHELASTGAEVVLRRGGRTGTIVVLVDDTGERTMLTDRAAATQLADAEPGWLDGTTALHVPYYSLAVEPLGSTSRQLVEWAHDRSILVSVDVSSTMLIGAAGADQVAAELRQLRPAVVLCNADEAAALGDDRLLAGLSSTVTVIKQGPRPVRLLHDGGVSEIPARAVGAVADTTGAGDAFAAAFVTTLAAGADVESAASAGHELAAELLSSRSG